MKPDQLFARRFDQLVELENSTDEFEVLNSSTTLRQFFYDKVPLVHKVNEIPRLKFLFDIAIPSAGFALALKSGGNSFAMYDLDPKRQPPGSKNITVRYSKLLKHPILVAAGQVYSVGDVIKHSANVAGGVHSDQNPKTKDVALTEFSEWLQDDGLPAGLARLKSIELSSKDFTLSEKSLRSNSSD